VELDQQQAADGHAALLINLGYALDTKGMILGRADAEPSLGRSGEALAAFQKAIDIAEELTKKDSIDFLSRYAEANYALEAGNVLRHRDSRRALAVYDQAIARIREAKANSSTQRHEAELLAASSYPVRWMGSTAKAQQRIDRAFQLLGDTHMYPADKIEPISDAYHALQAQADHYSETGQTQKAIDTYQQLLEKLGAWGSKPDDDLRDATCISRTWTALAGLLRRTGRTDEAKRLEAQRTELWGHWKAKLPNAQFLLRQSLVQIAPPAVSRSTAKR